MALDKINRCNKAAIFIFFTGLAILVALLSPQTASANHAADNRAPYNGSETNARDKCVSEGWQDLRYGAIWISTGSYYAGSVSVGASTNTTTVYIGGSVYGCHSSQSNNTYAVDIAPKGANAWRLTNLSGTSLFRGASQGMHNWSTQGDQISATLDVSGIATNNQSGPASETITIELWRCFSTNSSTATGSCYTEVIPVTVNRAAQPQSTVQGRIYDIRNGNGFSGVTVEFCNGQGTTTTDSSGNFTKTITNGVGFCVRVAAGGPSGAIAGPNVRPWSEGYPGVTPGCPGFNSDTTTPLVNGKNYCAQGTYECQIAGTQASIDACGGSSIDRSWDGGYDIVYETSAPGISCSRARTTPTSPEINQSFSLSVGYNTTGGTATDTYTYSITITGTTPFLFTTPVTVGSGSYTGSSNRTGNRNNITTATAQGYKIDWTVTVTGAATANLSCTDTIYVVTKPYFKVFGGDITVGGGFSSSGSCSIRANSMITAFNSGGAAYKGAGSQIASYANGKIDGFSSSINRAQEPLAPKGLAFANRDPIYGGNLNSSNLVCAPDYYSQASSLPDNISGASFIVNPATRGEIYKQNGNLSISNTVPLANRTGITIFVDGDVTITSNITFAAWNGAGNIPSFVLAAKGDIYIDPSVTRIDGILIAQPDSAGTRGRVVTCTVNFSDTTDLKSRLNGVCGNNKLTVRGAVVARQIKMLRNKGTLFQSVDNELATSANIAEMFIFSPEVWIYGMYNGSSQKSIYDSITAMPPVL